VGASPARFLTPVVVWCGVLDRRSSSCGAYAGVVSISDRAVCYTMLHPHSQRRRGSSISTTGWGSTLLSILRERRRLGIFWLSRTCTNRGLNFEREKRERQSCGFEPHKERKEAEKGCGNQGRAAGKKMQNLHGCQSWQSGCVSSAATCAPCHQSHVRSTCCVGVRAGEAASGGVCPLVSLMKAAMPWSLTVYCEPFVSPLSMLKSSAKQASRSAGV
jgi:hypothetical protein